MVAPLFFVKEIYMDDTFKGLRKIHPTLTVDKSEVPVFVPSGPKVNISEDTANLFKEFPPVIHDNGPITIEEVQAAKSIKLPTLEKILADMSDENIGKGLINIFDDCKEEQEVSDMMAMPETAEEFIRTYSFPDAEEQYGNDDLIQLSYVHTMIKHYFSETIPDTVEDYIRNHMFVDDKHYNGLDNGLLMMQVPYVYEMINTYFRKVETESKEEETMEPKEMPATVEEFIEERSFPDTEGRYTAENLMTVSSVKEMICHYFSTRNTNLSADDFVAAINVNIDNLVAKMEEENKPEDLLVKTSLLFTKRFINEFVETAVVKTADTEEEFNLATAKLSDTVSMMISEDYKERFKAEYYQLLIRYSALERMCLNWDHGELNFTPTCPRSTYDLQLRAMNDYLSVLEARAKIEDIKL